MVTWECIDMKTIIGSPKMDYKYNYQTKTTEYVYNIPIAFDIETTSAYTHKGDKIGYMYLWTMAINGTAFYGRTIEELKACLKKISLFLQLDAVHRIYVYVHNLAFEFQFIHKYFNWDLVFAIDERRVIRAVSGNIEFRDNYILSALSLETLAKNLKSGIQKLKGDLDYSLIRNPDTPMSDKELSYCENDVLIITEYIGEQIKEYNGRITQIPLTNTGRVRQYMRKMCMPKKSSSGKRYRELMRTLTLTAQEYIMCKRAFMGGFVHASLEYVGRTVHDVASIDFNSSYPYALVSEQYPMSAPIWTKDSDTLLKNLSVFKVRFTGLNCVFTFDGYLSKHKCHCDNDVTVNGRIYNADTLETYITNIDYEIIKRVYEWQTMEILTGFYFYSDYLPKSFIKGILTLYKMKTELKGIPDKADEYLRNKSMTNSTYGMCVTDIIRDYINYSTETHEWEKLKPDMTKMMEQIDKNNCSENRFIFYPWGIFCTAFSRRNLWYNILKINDDYIYSDTDSIKLINYDRHKKDIEEYNDMCFKKLQKMCDYWHIDINDCRPKGRLLGVFDYEGTSKRFKTLGAKRYLAYDGKDYKLTVAGLSKQNGMKYIKDICDNDCDKIFEMFNEDLTIPPDKTGKKTHTYIDNEMESDIMDYTGKMFHVKQLSGLHLSDCGYDMSIDNQYLYWIGQYMQGHILSKDNAVL